MSSEIGFLIRQERRKQKLTLRALAAKCGIDYSLISKYENGAVSPSEDRLALIAQALGVPVSQLAPDPSANVRAIMTLQSLAMSTNVDSDRMVLSKSNIGNLVVEQANGRCELCENVFPYGTKFLESHFIVWLQNGGEPTMENTVALCPNCHKRIHLCSDPEDTQRLLAAVKARKQGPQN